MTYGRQSTAHAQGVRPMTAREHAVNADRFARWPDYGPATCGLSPKCKAPPAYVVTWSYVSGRKGRVTRAERQCCEAHAHKFATLYGLELGLQPGAESDSDKVKLEGFAERYPVIEG